MLLNRNVLKRIFLIVCISLCVNTLSKAEICDSIGVERVDGKLFILHRITSGETLYSISKKYKASVDDVKKANPTLAQGLQVGQILKVPTTLPVSPAATTSSTLESSKTHTVAAGETLYSITTKYKISVDELKKVNSGLSNSISVGQVLNIPVKGQSTTAATTPPVASKEIIEHKVASGETLYSIAKKYNVSVEDIKKANPGIGALKVGQVIKVVGAETAVATTTAKPTKPTTTSVATTTTTTTTPVTKPATTTNVETDTVQLQQDKVRLETMTPTTPKTIPATDFKKITETGFADAMADNLDTQKYLAYHKTAPIGTIIQLLNESNGIKVYVRVIGKLTDAGTDGKTIIRISKKAYERLGGTGSRFSASLMYIP